MKRASAILLIILFAVTPLLVTSFTYELFEFPKMMFVYVITIILVAISFSRLIIDYRWWKVENSSRKLKIENRKISILYLLTSKVHFPSSIIHCPIELWLSVFLLFNVISSLFSTFPYTAWWGYYSRFSGGAISLLCYGALFFIIKLQSKNTIRTILLTVLITSGLVSIYGIAQHFGLENGRWVQDVQARVFSSFGQPNWLAAFLVLILPLNLYFLIIESDRLKKTGLMILAVLNFSTLWFTFSVSGISAFAICYLLFVTFFATGKGRHAKHERSERYLLDEKIKQRNWRWLVLLICLWTGVCLWQPGLAKARFGDAVDAISKRVSLAATAYAASNDFQVGDTGNIRLILWPSVLQAAVSSPKNLLIGTGPETFAYAFLPFRPVAMNNTSESGFLYNKAHNYFLDLLINTGLFGLSAYILLNAVAVVTAFRKRQNVLNLAIGSALIGNLITNFFGWPTVTSSLVFFLYLAVLDTKHYE